VAQVGDEALDQQPRRLCCNGVLPRNLRHEDLAARRLVVAPGRPTTGTILNATTSTDTRRGLRASAPGDGDNEVLLSSARRYSDHGASIAHTTFRCSYDAFVSNIVAFRFQRRRFIGQRPHAIHSTGLIQLA
jgi:hypothetical protein